MQNLAEVHCWGQLVGALACNPSDKISTREFKQLMQDPVIYSNKYNFL